MIGNFSAHGACPHEICPLHGDLEELKQDVAALRLCMDQLLGAWNGARGVAFTLKWLAGIAAGVGALWVAWRPA
ncbi:MAG: hypothetical protein HQL51_10130 [Magnetococcales bacterium]|nr:hypothetical protein [Magnetococcales bacterium]